MKLVPDWKRILFTSYSMLAQILGIVALGGSNILYSQAEIETDPYAIGLAAMVLLVLGTLGRIVDQRATPAWMKMPFYVAMIFSVLVIFGSFGKALYEDATLPEVEVEDANLQEEKVVVLAMSDLPKPAKTIQAKGGGDFDSIAFKFIARWEGKRNTAYLDIVGVPTICYGHTRTVSRSDVNRRVTWSDARCKSLLIEEIHEYRDNWLKYVSSDTKRNRLTTGRTVAYTSLAFNVGWSGAGKSTATRRLNAGDIAGGCHAITWWNKAGGRVVRGLVLRRSGEKQLCLA